MEDTVVVNKEQEQETEVRKIKGWRDVTINPDMPLSAIVEFLNILNQRLCSIEDNILVQDENGDHISVTELYARKAAEESKGE